MNTGKISSRRWQHFALTSLALAMTWAGTAHGAEYWLCAKKTDVTLPGGVTVPMWGYAKGPDSAGSCTAAASVPGPALIVPVGEGLTVHLRNFDLPEPTSLVIPGQVTAMSPVRHAGGGFDGRVRSFTAEAAIGADQTYTWADLKPGTYLYHSGTHPQVQVQMGLYGAMTHDASAGHAYAGVPYSSQVTVLFSEVDRVLHDAVDAGRYGQPVPNPIPAGLTAADYPSSTIDYAPQYFLINGAAYPAASLMNLAAGNAGQTTLLRLLNAGLQSRSPLLQGMHMRLMAEDGNPSPYSSEQYSVFLPALKTVDAVITPDAAARYPFYDRRLGTINPGASGSTDGGMLAFLQVSGPASGTPSAVNDAYATAEDTPLSVPIAGVLDNDAAPAGTTASWLSGPSHGSVSLQPNGSFTYTPASHYNGSDSFSYRAMSGGVPSLPATVSLTVTAVNDRPIAATDTYSVAAGSTLTVAAQGVLGNDSDADGQPLTAVNASALTGRSALDTNGSFTYTAPSTAGNRSFTYRASDGTLDSNPVTTVTISVTANVAPVAVNDTFSASPRSSAAYTPVPLDVLANDTDANDNLDPTRVTIVTQPNKGGTVTVNLVTGIVSYTPKRNFRGTENFGYRVRDTANAQSNTATVKVNVK